MFTSAIQRFQTLRVMCTEVWNRHHVFKIADFHWLFKTVDYLVNKPLPAAGISADNVRGWEIVRKMNIWPRSEASRANVKFWGQSLSQGHYQPIYQQAGKGFIYFITLPLIFFAIKPRVNMVKKPVVIWWRMRAWLTWGSKSKFDWFN